MININNFSKDQISDVIRVLKKEVPLEITMDENISIDVLEITDRGWVYYQIAEGDLIEKVRVSELGDCLLSHNRYLVDYVVLRNMGY